MQITIRTATNKLALTADVKNTAEAFQMIADFQEIFEVSGCGHCGKNNLKFVFRNSQGFDFHEIACEDCGYRLQFGQKREDNSLFPKRKDKAGNWLNYNGWVPPFKGGATGSDIDF